MDYVTTMMACCQEFHFLPLKENTKSQRISHGNFMSPREVRLAYQEPASFTAFGYKVLQPPSALLKIRRQLYAPDP
jgi:hypothetical protein